VSAREVPPGRRFTRLVVIREGRGWYGKHHQRQRRRTIVCQCDCGNVREVIIDGLLSGATKSCGCLKAERFKRGSPHRGLGWQQGGVTAPMNSPEKGK
jgi:hypothetical protein